MSCNKRDDIISVSVKPTDILSNDDVFAVDLLYVLVDA